MRPYKLRRFLQSHAERTRPIRQQFLPADLEGLEIDLAVDFSNEIVLAREIPIKQRLGHAEFAGQRTRAAAKSLLCKKLGRFGDEFTATVSS